MARTYWKKLPDNSLEFMGAFREAHKPGANSPQAKALILDFPDVTDAQAMVDKLGMETREAPPRLASLPTSITKRLAAGAVSVPWSQVEGFIK